MKQTFVLLLIVLFVILAVIIVPLLDCGDPLPKGNYQISDQDIINYSNQTELKKQLIAKGSDFKLSLHFWEIHKINGKTYLVVFGQNQKEKIYFHLLVKNMDENITKLATTGGYRHALLKDLTWSYKKIDGVEEMVYQNMLKILD